MPINVDTIQIVPADEHTVLRRFTGTPPHAGEAELRLSGHRFAALPAPAAAGTGNGRRQAAFAIPKDLLEQGDGPLRLEVGDSGTTLPRILPGPEAKAALGPLGPVMGGPERLVHVACEGTSDAHVLVVDDDELVRMAVAVTLEQEGYAVTPASDGAEALRLLDEALPDLIVSDVMMPDVDGLSLVARVRAKLDRRPVPAEMLRYDPRTGAPEIKRHKRWFALYLVVSTLFFTEFKNVIARVAQIKELVGERHWKVTPRG